MKTSDLHLDCQRSALPEQGTIYAMPKISSTQVTHCARGYEFHSNVKLVRLDGRKSVRVILRPLHSHTSPLTDEEIAIRGAKFASSKGWRKVVVSPDSYKGKTLRAFNLHQYYHEEWQRGYIGAFLLVLDFND